jgi:hypothetical protein
MTHPQLMVTRSPASYRWLRLARPGPVIAVVTAAAVRSWPSTRVPSRCFSSRRCPGNHLGKIVRSALT